MPSRALRPRARWLAALALAGCSTVTARVEHTQAVDRAWRVAPLDVPGSAQEVERVTLRFVDGHELTLKDTAVVGTVEGVRILEPDGKRDFPRDAIREVELVRRVDTRTVSAVRRETSAGAGALAALGGLLALPVVLFVLEAGL
ncbi:MAG: hypothetical protein U1F43_28030 [Myxococcota bacterium]